MPEKTCFSHWVFLAPWHENREQMFSLSVATSKNCVAFLYHFQQGVCHPWRQLVPAHSNVLSL